MPGIIRRWLPVCVVQLTFVFVTSLLYLLWNNSLANNGRWEVSKTCLQVACMGEFAYLERAQALARGHLNLGAWHGFHEVIYKRPLSPSELHFRFLLGGGAYFSLIYSRDDHAFSGIRLSANPKFESVLFKASRDGEFLSKAPIEVPAIEVSVWHTLHLLLSESGSSVELDGERVNLPGFEWQTPNTLGFRGCNAMVLIDDIVARTDSGTVRESFFNLRPWPRAAGIAMAAVLVFNFVVAFLMWIAKFPAFHMRMGLIILNGLSGMTLVLIIAIVFLNQHKYPREGMIPKDTVNFVRDYGVKVLRERTAKLAAKPPPGTERIVFLGTSQTVGSGATRLADTFVNRVQKELLSDPSLTTKYECINAGVGGGDSSFLARLYRELLLPLCPSVLVINLATNDTSGARLTGNLTRILDENAKRGIKTMLVLEPNSIECWPDDMPNHPIMRELAEKRQIPCLELHRYMKERYDSGFLWWDFVHPTSYGHRLIAERIVAALREYGLVQ